MTRMLKFGMIYSSIVLAGLIAFAETEAQACTQLRPAPAPGCSEIQIYQLTKRTIQLGDTKLTSCTDICAPLMATSCERYPDHYFVQNTQGEIFSINRIDTKTELGRDCVCMEADDSGPAGAEGAGESCKPDQLRCRSAAPPKTLCPGE